MESKKRKYLTFIPTALESKARLTVGHIQKQVHTSRKWKYSEICKRCLTFGYVNVIK